MESPKVIGRIFLPEPKETDIYCTHCGIKCNDSFGDSRNTVTTYSVDGFKKVELLCDDCYSEMVDSVI